MQNATDRYEGIPLGPTLAFTDLEYADDVAVLGSDPSSLQPILDSIAAHASMVGVNSRKTKYFTTAVGPHPLLMVEGSCIEQVKAFRYLGSTILPTGQAKDEIPVRISAARLAFSRLRGPLFKRTEISLATKPRVYRRTVVKPSRFESRMRGSWRSLTTGASDVSLAHGE